MASPPPTFASAVAYTLDDLFFGRRAYSLSRVDQRVHPYSLTMDGDDLLLDACTPVGWDINAEGQLLLCWAPDHETPLWASFRRCELPAKGTFEDTGAPVDTLILVGVDPEALRSTLTAGDHLYAVTLREGDMAVLTRCNAFERARRLGKKTVSPRGESTFGLPYYVLKYLGYTPREWTTRYDNRTLHVEIRE